MKLSSALPLVVAAGLLVPANGAVADEPQDLSDVSDRVNFNPDTGELTLDGPEQLSPAERERALASVLDGFRQLVDGCFDGGSSSDTYAGGRTGKLTLYCGGGVSVSSCTFKRDPYKEFLSCMFPGGEKAGFSHATSVQRRKIPDLEGDWCSPFGCMGVATSEDIAFFGTNTLASNASGNVGPLLTLRSFKIEIPVQGQRGAVNWDLVRDSAGPDSFGNERANDGLLGKAAPPFVREVGEKFDAVAATNRAQLKTP